MAAISMVAGPGVSGSGGCWAGAPVGQVSALGRLQPPRVYLARCWAKGGGRGGPQGPLPSQQPCRVDGTGEGGFDASWAMPGLCPLPGTPRRGREPLGSYRTPNMGGMTPPSTHRRAERGRGAQSGLAQPLQYLHSPQARLSCKPRPPPQSLGGQGPPQADRSPGTPRDSHPPPHSPAGRSCWRWCRTRCCHPSA